jgi:hypothetical protein
MSVRNVRIITPTVAQIQRGCHLHTSLLNLFRRDSEQLLQDFDRQTRSSESSSLASFTIRSKLSKITAWRDLPEGNKNILKFFAPRLGKGRPGILDKCGFGDAPASLKMRTDITDFPCSCRMEVPSQSKDGSAVHLAWGAAGIPQFSAGFKPHKSAKRAR